jgi:hypothetical protein
LIPLLNTKVHRQITLRVEIDEQRLFSFIKQGIIKIVFGIEWETVEVRVLSPVYTKG